MFTSQTAVEAVKVALSLAVSVDASCEEEVQGRLLSSEQEPAWRWKVKEQWSSHPVFVVGKATAQAGR